MYSTEAIAHRCRLLELEDELLFHHILSRERGISLGDVANTCRRLCKLARLTIQVITIEEREGPDAVSHWPADLTFAGCRGLEYYATDEGVILEGGGARGLPLLERLLPHVCSYWTSLTELALVLEVEQPLGPHRCANDILTAHLSTLTGIHSLRHLQLYKTAPLQNDATQLALLTQLTSLLLADQSYMPGHSAMVCVNLDALVKLTNLQSLGVSGVCPDTARVMERYQETRANRLQPEAQLQPALSPAMESAFGLALQEGTVLASDVQLGFLPPSLTSLILKNLDIPGLLCWEPQLYRLTGLRQLAFEQCAEPSTGERFETFPAPFLELLATAMPGLSSMSFSLSSIDNPRMHAGYEATASRLPHSIARLQHLRLLELHWCQLSVQSEEDWAAIARLTQLTVLGDLDIFVPPLPEVVLTNLSRLSCTNAKMWGDGQQWSIATTCPNLSELSMAVHKPRDWLAVSPVISALSGLQSLKLDFRCKLDTESALNLLQLGQQLPLLKALVLLWAGGPDGWLLPRLHTFTQLEFLHLGLHRPGIAVPQYTFDPCRLNDTVLLAHLSPLLGLKQLLLYRFPVITPAALIAVQGIMPKLEILYVIQCDNVMLLGDGDADWAGTDLQMAHAAMYDAVAAGRQYIDVEICSRLSDILRRWRTLPCEVAFVTAHEQCF